MNELKTKVNDSSVEDFLNAVPDEIKRADSFELLRMFTEITNESAEMWGTSIVGFGQYHYKSEQSNHEGDWPLTGFSPRKTALTLYLGLNVDQYAEYLAKLGKHKTGKGCLYINKLADVDIVTLRNLIDVSFHDMKRQYV